MSSNRIQIILTVLLALIIVLSAVSLISGMNYSDSQNVCIIQNGKILYQLDLNREEDRTIRIDGEDGAFNVVEIKNHRIFIKESDCPDKVCIHTGVLRSENMPVVCLPNRLIIRFEGEQK